MRSARTALSVACAAMLLTACSTAPLEREPDENDLDPVLADLDLEYATVREAFVTARTPDDNIDSPAVWADGVDRTILLATAKASGRLMLYDGGTGTSIDSGAPATAAGGFDRPNGVFVQGGLAFVVERDAHRVRVLRLPGLEPIGQFGTSELRKPYGLWLRERAPGGYEVLVTDAYMAGVDAGGEELTPPLAELDRRIKRYEVTVGENGLHARFVEAFGDTTPEGAIRVPESIWGDPAHDRLLIAEEDAVTGTALREYGLDGRYRGRTIGLGLFKAQAEGIALWACADGSGYWLATDQFEDRSLFHVFDRESLRYLGAFAGTVAGNTDGVWLHAGASARFPQGAFYAVHDDMAVAAFDWRDIADALGLRQSCPR